MTRGWLGVYIQKRDAGDRRVARPRRAHGRSGRRRDVGHARVQSGHRGRRRHRRVRRQQDQRVDRACRIMVARTAIGKKVKVKVIRRGKTKTVDVEIGELKEEEEAGPEEGKAEDVRPLRSDADSGDRREPRDRLDVKGVGGGGESSRAAPPTMPGCSAATSSSRSTASRWRTWRDYRKAIEEGREREERPLPRAARRQHHLPGIEAGGEVERGSLPELPGDRGTPGPLASMLRRIFLGLLAAASWSSPWSPWSPGVTYGVLDAIVVEKFNGRRWEFPSRVYSDSFLIYPGIDLNAAGFFDRLRRLNYRQVSEKPLRKGDFRHTDSGLEHLSARLRLPGWRPQRPTGRSRARKAAC